MLKQFNYKFDQGPLSTKEDLLDDWDIGNCRRAVQYYFFQKKDIFLKPEQVLCPDAYHKTGIFVAEGNVQINFKNLKDADIIYAKKIRSKEGKTVNKSREIFPSDDEYVISLHTALFTSEKGKEIWHASAIEGGSAYWSLEKFLHFYKPIAVKRIT